MPKASSLGTPIVSRATPWTAAVSFICLTSKILKDLKFASFTFENNPQGKLMLSVLLGFSKYYVDALSENVKRGKSHELEMRLAPESRASRLPKRPLHQDHPA